MFMSDSTTYSATSTTSINDNKWHYLTGTYDGETLKVYVDGVFEDDNTDPSGNLPTDTGALRIGADYQATPANFFNGLIDDTRIYNRALSASEIKRLYNMGATALQIKSPTNSLTNGLVGYWTFDGKDISGTNAYDRSPVGTNTGTITGATKTIGKLGQALNFTLIPDSLVIAGSDLLGTGTITICAWANPRSSGEDGIGTVVGNSRTGLLGNGSVWWLTSNGLSNQASSVNGSFVLNTWQHICGVRLSSGLGTMYINGVVSNTENQNTGTPQTFGYGPVIGAFRSDGIQTFDGLIDDVRIYSRALGASEIKRLYNIGATALQIKSPTNSLTNGLVGYWTFDGADISGDQAYDRSPVGTNTGTITGATKTIGKLGQGLKFNGVEGSSQKVAMSSDFIGANTATICAWAKPKSTGGGGYGQIVNNAPLYFGADINNKWSLS